MLACSIPHHLILPSNCHSSRRPQSALQQYGRDLTDEARRGLLDPVIGREQVLQRTLQVGMHACGHRARASDRVCQQPPDLLLMCSSSSSSMALLLTPTAAAAGA
jgi:hypothetical protein